MSNFIKFVPLVDFLSQMYYYTFEVNNYEKKERNKLNKISRRKK